MWNKGVFGVLFLLLVDLPAFLIHQQLGDIERTSLFYVTALPAAKEHLSLSELSVKDIPIINPWENVVIRYKRQDEPSLTEDETLVDNALDDTEDLIVEEETSEDIVEEQPESSGNGEEGSENILEEGEMEEVDDLSEVDTELVNEEEESDGILDDSYYENMDAEGDEGEEEEEEGDVEEESVVEETLDDPDEITTATEETISEPDEMIDGSIPESLDTEEDEVPEEGDGEESDMEEESIDDSEISTPEDTTQIEEENNLENSEMVNNELSESDLSESEVENVLDNPLEITTTLAPTTTMAPTTTTPPFIPCSNSTFGCCENSDDNYPSHGPHQEGCCLSTNFSCCPDLITPATGPHYEGCDCINSEFGCCEAPEVVDTNTENLDDTEETIPSPNSSPRIIGKASRDENKKGCGCLLTPHGCCPDQYTVAKGADIATDCPCDTQDYGCCPDGTTAAQGPHLEGCKKCEDSEFGCCADNRTPSSDSDVNIGCDCSSSEFGCCPDGISLAEGDNFTGCDEIPGEECHLPKDIGTCIEQEAFKENYTRRYFFDISFGACSPFYWSGDCNDGNETVDDEDNMTKIKNNFLDLKSCKDKCVNPVGSGRCYLPKVVGPGRAAIDRWFYDVELNKCAHFIYGGLLGNTNNFNDKKECERTCETNVKELNLCSQPVDPGPCRGEYLRWYYNDVEGSCSPFNFTGCKGNLNRFMNKDDCENSCKHESKKVLSKIICSKPKPTSDGYCDPEDMKAKWYFNKAARLCEPFYYGNCKLTLNPLSTLNEDEENLFDTQDECENICPNTFPPEIFIKEKVC